MFLFASNKFVLVLQGRSIVDTHKTLFVQCVSPINITGYEKVKSVDSVSQSLVLEGDKLAPF